MSGKEKKRRRGRKGKRKERRSVEVGSSILLTRLKIIISLFFKRSPSIKKTSASITTWKCNFPPKRPTTNLPTNKLTNQLTVMRKGRK